MPETEIDELSFGDDREPWSREWITTHRRLAALLVAVAVALTGLGAGGWYLHRRSLLPSPPPDVMNVSPRMPDFWAGKADLSVAMCGVRGRQPRRNRCGPDAATPAQRDAVVARLRETDGVAEVFLQDRAFGLRLARRYASGPPSLTLDDVPEILYVRFDDPSRAKFVGQAMLRMPGVGWSQLIK